MEVHEQPNLPWLSLKLELFVKPMSLSSRVLLRWSWSLLFLWFGTQQLLHPGDWIGFLPEWTGYFPVPAEMLIQLNGWSEVVLAVALALGCFTRIVSAVLALHLLGIAVTVQGATGVRDAALGMVGISLALSEPDAWTLDYRTKK